jgi:hypothetical protein
LSSRGAVFALIAGVVSTTPAFAFGSLGHEVVAELASRQLNPAAKREVERLFDKPADVALREASVWPDQIKGLKALGALGPLHYVSMPKDQCTLDREKLCPRGNCVVSALETFTVNLGDAANDAVRAEAVRWVVHLVGDIHTPLHAFDVDKGGNDYQLQFRGEGTNLHQLWDSGLTRHREQDPERFADRLERANIRASSSGVPADWATESCRVASTLYPPKSRTIDQAYVDTNVTTAERRMVEAAARLAAILNRTLDRPAAPVPYR